jgi:hypothetical protein
MPRMAGRRALARMALAATLTTGAGLVAAGVHGVLGLDGRLQAVQRPHLVRDVTPPRGDCPQEHQRRARPLPPRDAGV